MKIAMSSTREKYPLSTKKVIKKTLLGTLVFVLLASILYFAVSLMVLNASEGPVGSIGAILLVGFVLLLSLVFLGVYLYQKWYYAVYFYDLNDDYIVIKKGPITPREITIPYERIQDVYVDQDLLDRIFGLYDVHLSSATVASGMEAHIDGLEKQAAEGIRALLLQTVKERISRKRGGENFISTSAQ